MASSDGYGGRALQVPKCIKQVPFDDGGIGVYDSTTGQTWRFSEDCNAFVPCDENGIPIAGNCQDGMCPRALLPEVFHFGMPLGMPLGLLPLGMPLGMPLGLLPHGHISLPSFDNIAKVCSGAKSCLDRAGNCGGCPEPSSKFTGVGGLGNAVDVSVQRNDITPDGGMISSSQRTSIKSGDHGSVRVYSHSFSSVGGNGGD
jgi:hypothetical protein